ncbi:MAG: S8 family serine peptidase [Bacteroidales bacterium]|nr:S8 family serine peptidase [Bacteroidales bacterium]
MKTINKIQIFLVVMIILPVAVFAQSNFYYTFDNEKIFLTEISGKYLVEFPNGIYPGVKNSMASGSIQQPGTRVDDKLYITLDTINLSLYSSTCYITPAYITNEGAEMYETRSIVLKFKNSTSSSERISLINSYNLINVDSNDVFELYLCNDALQISKAIYESGLVKYCTPDFLTRVESTSLPPVEPNDEYFGKQFYLHNTGQTINDGHSGTVDADIDAPEAWDITKGNSNIIVAVIDKGVSSNHPDLPNTRQVRLPGSNCAAGYDGTDPNDPSPILLSNTDNNHGNACAGIVAATQNNNIGVTGIAPLCKIMPVRVPIAIYTSSYIANGIRFAADNGANILSISWDYPNATNPNHVPVIVEAIEYAINGGSTVICTAGNTANLINGNEGYVSFPGCANIENLITVGASDRNDWIANYSPIDTEGKMEIVAPSHTAYNSQIPGEAYNVWTIDCPGVYGSNPWKYSQTNPLPMVGEILPSSGSDHLSYTGRFGGTSAAAPQVAGVVALMLSVNECLSPYQIKDLLQKTADKINIGVFDYFWDYNHPGHSQPFGYGRLNAHKAVLAAQSFYSTTLDLYMRDTYNDLGYNAGYPWGWYFDNSPDIWVRNQNDGLTNYEHQNPIYSSTTPVFVYVRVGNKSCVPWTPVGEEEILSLYWTKAASASSWPVNWDGTDPLIGDKIASTSIPPLQPGESTIIEFEWYIPNPSIYSNTLSCLLARIENVPDDPITVHPNDFSQDVYQNNNVSLRNCKIISIYAGIEPVIIGGVRYPQGSFMYVGNPDGIADTYDIIFKAPDSIQGNPITKEAEVSIKFNGTGWTIFQPQFGNREDIIVRDDSSIIILEDEVIFSELNFPANTRVPIYIGFSFLTDELTDKNEFEYHVVQKYSAQYPVLGDHWTGGVHFRVTKYERNPFDADAGSDKEIDKGDSLTISAIQIAEAAEYNWYGPTGNLLYTGKDLTVSPDITIKYKLEVIAETDGFKDYDEVEVNVNRYKINSLSPNPTSNSVTVTYDAEDAGSAYLIIIGTNVLGSVNNYIIDCTQTQTNINMSNYQVGIYTVALVCDGQIVDAKALAIQ